MANYIQQEMPDLTKTGERKVYYRMENSGNITTDELIQKICDHPGLGTSEGVARLVLATLSKEVAVLMAEGHSVTLDGIGTFAATIDLNKNAKPTDTTDTTTERNATSLTVSSIKFRPDRQWVKEVAVRCKLERGEKHRVNQSPYTKAERLERALAYLEEPGHLFMRVADYAALTRLPRSTASKELRELAEQPNSGLTYEGRGSSKVYVKA